MIPGRVADAWLLERLPQLAGARVHSAFGSAINLVDVTGEMFTLATEAVPPAPRTLIVATRTFPSLAPGRPLELIPTGLRLGALRIGLDQVSAWQQERLPGPVVSSRLEVFRLELLDQGQTGGVLPGADSFSQAVAERIQAGLASINQAVKDANPGALQDAAQQLVGLGNGLTPAGDDVLTGIAFGAAQLGGDLSAIPPAILATPLATNQIAATAIREACAGRAVVPLTEVLALCCGHGTTDQLPAAVCDLVAIGHSSGTDLAHGLLCAATLSIRHPSQPMSEELYAH